MHKLACLACLAGRKLRQQQWYQISSTSGMQRPAQCDPPHTAHVFQDIFTRQVACAVCCTSAAAYMSVTGCLLMLTSQTIMFNTFRTEHRHANNLEHAQQHLDW